MTIMLRSNCGGFFQREYRRRRLGDPREQGEQEKRPDQAGRQDIAKRRDLCELRTGIHEHQGSSQHAKLANPVEGPDPYRRQPEQQIDEEEWENRHQPDREQIESALFVYTGIDLLEALPKALPHPIAQHIARHKKRQRRAHR
jgi:hypothetical protein